MEKVTAWHRGSWEEMNSLSWPWGLMLVASETSMSGPVWARSTFSIRGLWGKLLQGKLPQSQSATPTGSKPGCFQHPHHPRSDTSFSIPPCHGCRPPPQPQTEGCPFSLSLKEHTSGHLRGHRAKIQAGNQKQANLEQWTEELSWDGQQAAHHCNLHPH